MKVLLAYDGLERSRCVLEEASSMAAAIDRAVIVTVVSSAGTATRDDGPAELDAGGTAREADPLEQTLADAQAFLRDHGIEAEADLRHGPPGDAIEVGLAVKLLITGELG